MISGRLYTYAELTAARCVYCTQTMLVALGGGFCPEAKRATEGSSQTCLYLVQYEVLDVPSL